MAVLSKVRDFIEARVTRGPHFRAALWTLDLAEHLIADQCLGIASSLAFTTILSLVPLLAVFFAIFQTFTESQEIVSSVRHFLVTTFLADSVTEVTTLIEQFTTRAQSGTVGLVGFLFLLLTAVSLFFSIEQAFNRIWRVPAQRPLHRRVTTFYAVITLAPALIGLGVYVAGEISGELEALPFRLAFAAALSAWALEACALTLLYKLMPHSKVHWRSAAIGGAFAGTAFEASKALFNTYMTLVYSGSTNSMIYGSFALVPVFFLWVYILWIVVLTGVQLSYFIQHRRSLADEVQLRRGRRTAISRLAPTGYVTVRVFYEVARRFREVGGGIRIEEIGARLELAVDEVSPVILALKQRDYVLVVDGADTSLEIVPARPLDQITVGEIWSVPDADGLHAGDLRESAGTSLVEGVLRRAREGATAEMKATFEAILLEERAAANLKALRPAGP